MTTLYVPRMFQHTNQSLTKRLLKKLFNHSQREKLNNEQYNEYLECIVSYMYSIGMETKCWHRDFLVVNKQLKDSKSNWKQKYDEWIVKGKEWQTP